MANDSSTPFLIPIDQDKFWAKIRVTIREEILKLQLSNAESNTEFQTPGLIEKPLYKIAEVCKLFDITRPTIYEWVKCGKLKPFKIRSRVYFLWSDIQKLMPAAEGERH